MQVSLIFWGEHAPKRIAFFKSRLSKKCPKTPVLALNVVCGGRIFGALRTTSRLRGGGFGADASITNNEGGAEAEKKVIFCENFPKNVQKRRFCPIF